MYSSSSSFLWPRWLFLLGAGPEKAKNLAGKEVLRLIQIRLVDAEFEKEPGPLSRQFGASTNRRSEFNKRG